MDLSGSGINQEMDHRGTVLPSYVAHLSLMFKLTATLVNLSLSGCIIYTIKTTRSLHKSHNIFLANLLISGALLYLSGTLITGTMMISYQLGVVSPISCYIIRIKLLPLYVTIMSFVMIAADKALAVTSPFKHKRMMTRRTIGAIISGAWLLAAIPATYAIIFVTDDVIEVPEFGTCSYTTDGLNTFKLIVLLSAFSTSILTIALNVYTAKKAYQVHKQIEKETRLAGHNSQSDSLKALKKKQRNIRRNMKPIITLFVVVSGNIFVVLVFIPLNVLGGLYIDSQVYQELMDYVVTQNMEYVLQFFFALVYGLYFKQIREPLMKHMRRLLRLNKLNQVAPW